MTTYFTIAGVVYPAVGGTCLLLLLMVAARWGYRRVKAGVTVGGSGFYVEAERDIAGEGDLALKRDLVHAAGAFLARRPPGDRTPPEPGPEEGPAIGSPPTVTQLSGLASAWSGLRDGD